MRLLSLLLFFVIAYTDAMAQMPPLVQMNLKVKGTDEYESSPYILSGAYVHVYCEEDSTIFNKTLVSNSSGMVEMLAVAGTFDERRRMHVRISYVGMELIDSIFAPVKTKHKTLGSTLYRIGPDSITLRSRPVTLEEAQVVSELKKMYESGDTIIFNAQAYEMPSGSVLLELVRRLPGLLYDGNELTYNGRKIEEIRLNGDNFFSHDLSVALNNMPHDKIRSLKIYEAKTDTLNANSGKRLVMNVETDKMYRDVVFLNGELTAHPSPLDLDLQADAEAYRRKTYNASIKYIRQSIPCRQIQCESLERNLLSSSLRVDRWANLFITPKFNKERIGNRRITLQENMLPGFYNFTASDMHDESRSWEIGTGMPASISGKTGGGIGWDMSLGLNFKHNDDTSEDRRGTYSANPYVNGGDGDLHDDATLDSIRINSLEQSRRTVGDMLSLDWKGRMTKRSGNNDFGLCATMNIDDTKQKIHDMSTLSYMQMPDSAEVLDRIMSCPGSSLSATMQMFFNHTFGRGHHWGLEYKLDAIDQHMETQYYDVSDSESGSQFLTGGTTDGLSRIDSLSYNGSTTSWKNSLGANITFDWEHLRLEASGAAIPAHVNASTRKTAMPEEAKSYSKLLYSAAVSSRYKYGSSKVTAGYKYSEDTPSASMLMNVTDYSDPLNVRAGATDLAKTRRHVFSLQYDRGLDFSLNSTATVDMDVPSYRVTYDKVTGRSVSTPVPVNGNWNVMSNLHYTFNLLKRQFTFSASHMYRRTVNFIRSSGEDVGLKGKTDFNMLNAKLSHRIFSSSMMVLISAEYHLTGMSGQSFSMHSTQGEFKACANTSFYLPHNFDINADVTYSLRHGHDISELNRSRVVLNMMLGYKFLKRKASVQIECRDVFHQVRSTDISSMNYVRTESRIFGNTRMFLATFKYKFNLFGT